MEGITLSIVKKAKIWSMTVRGGAQDFLNFFLYDFIQKCDR